MEKCIDLRGRGLMVLDHIPFEEFIRYEYCILRHYTSSSLLDSIQKDGLLPPSQSNIQSSNFDSQSSDEDKHYIYLTGNQDWVFSKNAVELHGGKLVELTVKVALMSVEADDYSELYSSKGIDPKDMSIVHDKLTKGLWRNCRTRYSIKPEDILEILILD
ncbi:hypothetical protein [Sulfuricurvum sp.]|uniref:hypothetical protein n=1 Tax=Sulfuricurvum sp. TaxID=2025608 RepID=UPI003BAE1AED